MTNAFERFANVPITQRSIARWKVDVSDIETYGNPIESHSCILHADILLRILGSVPILSVNLSRFLRFPLIEIEAKGKVSVLCSIRTNCAIVAYQRNAYYRTRNRNKSYFSAKWPLFLRRLSISFPVIWIFFIFKVSRSMTFYVFVKMAWIRRSRQLLFLAT